MEGARRELQEGTGLAAECVEPVGQLFHSCSDSSRRVDLYVALGVSEGSPRLDAEEEGLVCAKFSLANFEAMLASGEIKDSSTVAAFGLARLKGFV